ncbi:MAG TPA: DUF2271 domain-containing protein [Lentimicrobium sp.]|nr:DUF2271 domain-containing protein [Lentimicrobium sp.]
MKKNITLFIFFALSLSVFCQTRGLLTVSVATSTAGGNYAPKNIIAIWIEDEQGHFVKTLMAYAATRMTHLNTWEASTSQAGSPYNVVDAITGATRSSHSTRTCTWNGTDVNGNVVADGIYSIRMELTDKNGTGNFTTFSFEKSLESVMLTPANVPSFSSISLNWEPDTTPTNGELFENKISLYPNPVDKLLTLSGSIITNIKVWDLKGNLILNTNKHIIDMSVYPNGIYLVNILNKSSKGITELNQTMKIIVQH